MKNDLALHIHKDNYQPAKHRPDVCFPTGSRELAMLDVYMPMMKSSAIISAARLGLFEALAHGPLPAADLSVKIQASVSGTTVLSNFLISIGYLERKGDNLFNSKSTQ
jgi:Dimerisation domain